MLVALDPVGISLMAWEAERGVDHRCPACGEAVTLKQGRKVIEHFAHQPGAACANAGETRQHLEMKYALYRAIYRPGAPEPCEIEHQIGERRADVWVPLKDGLKLAIECQHSAAPAGAVKQKVIDYAALAVNTLYVVHAEAFSDYDKRVGITSLHDRTITVPDWVREIATPQHHLIRREEQPYGPVSWGPLFPNAPTYVHVWANGRLWVLMLSAVYRESYWGRDAAPIVLTRKRHGQLLGEIEALNGPWVVFPPSHPFLVNSSANAFYSSMQDLAYLRTEHPSVSAALEAAPPTLPEQGKKGRADRRGCQPTSGGDAAPPSADSERGATGPTRPAPAPADVPQLGLGIEEPAVQSRRRPIYD